MHVGDARRSAQLSLQAQHAAHQRLDGTRLMPMESSEVSPGILSDPGIRELVSDAKGPCSTSQLAYSTVHVLPSSCWLARTYLLMDSRVCVG